MNTTKPNYIIVLYWFRLNLNSTIATWQTHDSHRNHFELKENNGHMTSLPIFSNGIVHAYKNNCHLHTEIIVNFTDSFTNKHTWHKSFMLGLLNPKSNIKFSNWHSFFLLNCSSFTFVLAVILEFFLKWLLNLFVTSRR